MENETAKHMAKELESVLVYAGQLSQVLHRHRLILETDSIIPIAVEDHISLVNSTVGTLSEVLNLLRHEAGTNQSQLFSEEGRRYVVFLVSECSEILQKIAPTVAKACSKGERKKKRKNAKKTKAEIIVPVMPKQLKLDEEKFSNDLENAIWYRVHDDTDAYMERLKEVQLHLLLVFQVVTVGSLSRDLSSGKVDIQKIVSYHERINRTADLVGFSPGSRRRRFRSRSSSVYTLSDSDSDSDVSSFVSRRRRNSRLPPPPPPPAARGPPPPGFQGPPPPPPPLAARGLPSGFHGPPLGHQAHQSYLAMQNLPPPPSINMTRPFVPTSTFLPGVIDLTTPNVNPPAYDSHRALNTPPLKQTLPFKNLPTYPHIPEEKSQDSKGNLTIKVEQEKAIKKPLESKVPEGQLFSSSHNRLSFKMKSLFRSKESLAAEMKKVLENTSSVLEAVLIQGSDISPIPHSAFHSLEATHMRTILSQLNDKNWFETFKTLTRTERDTLDSVVHSTGPEDLRREVVALKVLQNENNVWIRLAGKFHTAFLPEIYDARAILAILREPLVDGKRTIPIPDFGRVSHLQPPSHPPPPPAMLPSIRPPPTTAAPNSLSGPRIIGPDGPRPHAHGVCGGMPPPPQGHYLTAIPQSRGPPPPSLQASNMSDRTVYTDAATFIALTTYNEYTLRIADTQPNQYCNWSSITLTQESNSLSEILARVNAFNTRGNTIIDTKLHLTAQQSSHMTRLLEELQLKERDHRFEWCWAEVSLYDNIGQIAICSLGELARTATTMHLIAKRTLKREYKPSDVYHNLMTRGPVIPGPPPPPNFQNTLPPRPGPPPHMPGPPPPPPGAQPPVFIGRGRPRPRSTRRTRSVSNSDLDSLGSSGSDSDSSYDGRNRRVRRRRRNNGRTRRRYSDSENSDDSDDEKDIIKIPVVLKRGDDVVKTLLDLWTPGAEKLERSTTGLMKC